MTPDALTRTVQDFLSEASGAVVLEDGAVAFDLGQAKYSISGDYNKCLLHLWSAERNTVRRVLDAEVKNGTLKLAVQRLGQARPTRLEICRERDRRSPSAKKAARASYEQKLRRALDRHFPSFAVTRLTTVDLEKSFGPIYARGLLRHGQSAFAILGVNASETQASIDAALTFGILWLESYRHSSAGKFLVEGLSLFVPQGCSSLVRARVAHSSRHRYFAALHLPRNRVGIRCVRRGPGRGLVPFCPVQLWSFARRRRGGCEHRWLAWNDHSSHRSRDTGVWAAIKKSVQLSNGYEGALFLLVVESTAGSFVAWYATHYGMQLLFPVHLRYTVWYGWLVFVVAVLAGAAVDPPIFIGFSLLADPDRLKASTLPCSQHPPYID